MKASEAFWLTVLLAALVSLTIFVSPWFLGWIPAGLAYIYVAANVAALLYGDN